MSTGKKSKRRSDEEILNDKELIASVLKKMEERKASPSTLKKSSAGGRKKIGSRISIILPELLVKDLKEMAEETGVGAYQTLIRIILVEKIVQRQKDKGQEISKEDRSEAPTRRKNGVA